MHLKYKHLFNPSESLLTFYSHKSLFYFARSLITIFIPIYFLLIGFPFIAVLGWLLLRRVLDPFAALFAVKVAHKIGTRLTLFFSLTLTGLFYFLILELKSSHYLFIPLAFFISFVACGYWIISNSLFMKTSKKKEMGLELGVLDVLESIVCLFGPITGAFILTQFNMPFLVMVSVIILTMSIIPLILIKNIKFDLNFSLRDHTKKHKFNPKLIADILSRGFHAELMQLIFPLYLFVIGFEIMAVGWAAFLSVVAGFIVPLFIGKFMDLKDKNNHIVAIFGTALSSITWLIIALTSNEIILYICAFLFGVSAQALWLSIGDKVYSYGKERDPWYFGTLLEINDNLGRLIALSILIPLIILFGLQIAFISIFLIGIAFVIWDFNYNKIFNS